jgi:hypothetical protein
MNIKEPEIIINGHKITESMAMAIRVAIEIFAFDLCENGLGNDELGKEMTKLYLDRINEIRKVMR